HCKVSIDVPTEVGNSSFPYRPWSYLIIVLQYFNELVRRRFRRLCETGPPMAGSPVFFYPCLLSGRTLSLSGLQSSEKELYFTNRFQN
ncbi:hypothetical protein, partial [Echinicola shivajiensis]|uniref:hypothetical protein n=1 Tax=Echinicola shivajiensis TaxID=1035916 RepID=UPI001BFC6980